MPQNLVRLIRNLQRRNARRRLRLAVAEGVRLVEEAVAADVRFEGVAVSPVLTRSKRGTALRRELERRGASIEQLSDAELTDLADTDTPQGVVAVIEHPAWSTDDLEIETRGPLLVLDGVRDPGNVGALIRTSYALGACGVILLSGTARVNHPKVLRGAMGATFHLPVVQLQLDQFMAWQQQNDVTVWSAAPTGHDIRSLDPPTALAVLIGGEGSGVRPELMGLACETVCVPMSRRVDSLNVAVAAGILLHEIVNGS